MKSKKRITIMAVSMLRLDIRWAVQANKIAPTKKISPKNINNLVKN